MTQNEMQWFDLRLPDKRLLEVLVARDWHETPVVFHLGTPNAAAPFERLIKAAATRGLRVVTYSRPGYGRSSKDPDRSIADASMDVRDILDLLGYERFVAVGWSGGGPHALACAALMPKRCEAVAVVASFAPHGAAGLKWLAGMAQVNIEEFSRAVEGRGPLAEYLNEAAGAFVGGQGDLVSAMEGLITNVDRQVLRGELARFLGRSSESALSGGISGWLEDDLALVKSWGFDVEQIRCPVAVWHGDEDTVIPRSHAEWLVQHIPNSYAYLMDGSGHFTFAVSGFGEVLDSLHEIIKKREVSGSD